MTFKSKEKQSAKNVTYRKNTMHEYNASVMPCVRWAQLCWLR